LHDLQQWFEYQRDEYRESDVPAITTLPDLSIDRVRTAANHEQ